MKKVITIIMTLSLADGVSAFVLMGPSQLNGGANTLNENTLFTGGSSPPAGVTGHWQDIQSANLEDPYLGTPKDRTRFFRVNTPYLTYGFDQTFMQFFGQEGINAIDDAMRVINDFFEPEDKTYDGVSGATGVDLTAHGFAQNYATYWLNRTAENENLIDIKSLTLGYMVNRLGLGNPHRYAYTAYELDANNTAALGVAVWKTKLNNYDPLDPINTGKTATINNVQYSYRLIHNQAPGLNLSTFTTWNALIAEMEEYTDDTSGNAWSAVAAIVDAFYGNTQLTWITPPSQFNFGVYYDGMNASGGHYKPRHALTLDDAGGLKYLYSSNTVAMEFNPYRAVSPADYVKGVQNAYGEHNALASDPTRTPKPGNEVRLGANPWQPIHNPKPRTVFPLRNGGGVMLSPGNPSFPINPNNPLYHLQTAPNIGSFMDGTAFTGPGVGKMAWAYRGGVNKIKMVKLQYDSLLDTTPDGATFVWTDTFITNLNVDIPNTVGLPGAGYNIAGRPQYFTQMVGRNVTVPDFLFSARNLTPLNGIPIAFEENGTFNFNGGNPPTVGGIGANGFLAPTVYATGNNDLIADASWTSGGVRANPQASQPLGAANNGPGIWAPAETTTTFTLTFNSEYNIGGYEVVWQGETSVDGNSTVAPVVNQQWAHIYGPGTTDFVKFPDNIDFMGAQSYYTQWENSVLPVAGKPTISVVAKNGGNSPIGNNSFYRTQDFMTIRGSSFRNATAIQILGPNGDTTQLIYPVSAYVKSDSLIEIPKEIVEPGTRLTKNVIGFDSEGKSRRLIVWNTVGASEPNPSPFAVKTGRVVLSGTSHDGTVYYRDGPLTLYGYGFKSAFSASEDGNRTVTSIQISDSAGNPVWPAAGGMADISSYIQILSDTKALINSAAFPTAVDGLDRVVRVARSTTQTMSFANGKYVSFSTSKPTITDVICTYSANSYIDAANATVVPAFDLTPNNTGNPLRRDEAIRIIGSGFLGTQRIWLQNLTGGAFVPSVDINQSQFLSLGISVVNDNLIVMSKNAIQSAGADGFGSKQAKIALANTRDSAIPFGPFHVNIQPTVTNLTGLGNYDGNNTFNRGSTDPFTGALIGNEVFISGSGLYAIKYLRIQAVDSPDQWNSPPSVGGALPAGVIGPNIASPAPSITINSGASTTGVALDSNGSTMRVQTGTSSGYGTAVFTPVGSADANHTARYMQFKLQCEDRNRSIQFTPGNLANWFIVGVTPTVAALNIAADFQRDMDNASMTGTGLRLIDELEFVDQNNLTIAGTGTDLTFYPTHGAVPTNLIEPDPMGLRLDLNGSVIGWLNPSKHLADNVTAGSRLIRVTTPWGSTQLHNAVPSPAFRISGAIQFDPTEDVTLNTFTMLAGTDRWANARGDDTRNTVFNALGGFQPTLYASPQTGAGGYDYNGSTGAADWRSLVIQGSGFRGVSQINFRDTNATVFQGLNNLAVDPVAGTPAGITVNPTGTTITITGQFIQNGNATWAQAAQGANGFAGRYIELFTPNGQMNRTPTIETNATAL